MEAIPKPIKNPVRRKTGVGGGAFFAVDMFGALNVISFLSVVHH
jgi:hypothetical protein